ncbi:MAG: DUF7542 family protein, partial [Halobacteriota archaeon]
PLLPTSMTDTRVTVSCLDCSFREEFSRLSIARETLSTHAEDTGHEVTWDIHRLAAGVEQAGADAGVCGIPSLANEDSPLISDL